MQEVNIPVLQLHRLSETQFNTAIQNGNIDDNAFYLTPDNTPSNGGNSDSGETENCKYNKILDYIICEVVENNNGDKTITITDCNTSISGAHVIPETIEGYPVTHIGDYAFEKCVKLTDIVMPDTITTVGRNIFSECTNLTNVILSRGLTEIGIAMFQKTNLVNIKIPQNITKINKAAFQACPKLQSLIIPDSVVNIEEQICYQCSQLTNVVLPTNIEIIPQLAFMDCNALTTITIPSNVKEIGKQAFYSTTESSSLTDVYYEGTEDQWNEIVIGTYNEALSTATIRYNQVLSNKNYVDNGKIVEIQGESIFVNNVSPIEHELNIELISDTITDFSGVTVTRCGKNLLDMSTRPLSPAFGLTLEYLPMEDCYLLNGTATGTGNSNIETCNILLNDSIGLSVFYMGGTITKPEGGYAYFMTMGKDSSAGGGANWQSIELVDRDLTQPSTLKKKYLSQTWLRVSSGCEFVDYKFKIQITKGKPSAEFEPYKGQTLSPNIDGKVKGFKSISPNMYLFANTEGVEINCKYYKEQAIDELLNEIFATKKYVNEVAQNGVVGDSTNILNYISYTIVNNEVTITRSNNTPAISGSHIIPATIQGYPVTAIGTADDSTGVFEGTALTRIVIPATVKYIGKRCFRGCSELQTAVLSRGLEAIYTMAFYGCTKLDNIVIPETVQRIGNSTFKQAGLTKIAIPNSVKFLGNQIFANAPNLESVEINGFNYIVDEETSLITDVTLGGAIVYAASKLQKVCIGSGCEYLENYTASNNTVLGNFQSASNLTKLKLPRTLKTIGSQTFAGFTSEQLQNLHIYYEGTPTEWGAISKPDLGAATIHYYQSLEALAERIEELT